MRSRSAWLVGALLLGVAGIAGSYLLHNSRVRGALESGLSALAPEAQAPEEPAESMPESPGDASSSARESAGRAAQAAPQKNRVALSGRVVDENEAPVPVYDIEFVHSGLFHDEKHAAHVEALDGGFSCAALAPGSWTIRVRAEGLAMSDPGYGIKLPHEDIVLRLYHTARVSGIVMDPSGAPAADVRVDATRILGGTRAASTEATSDAQGRFGFDQLAPGSYAFEVPDQPCDPVLRTLAAGQDAEPILLQLKSGGTIAGEIAPEYLESFRGREVSLITTAWGQMRRAKQDRNGRFRAEHLRAGTWLILVDNSSSDSSGAMQLTATCEVQEGQTTRIVLGERSADSVRVSGRVLCHGAPTPGIEIGASLEGAPALQAMRVVRSDAQGCYQIVLDHGGPANFLLVKRESRAGAQYVRCVIPRVREHALDLELFEGSILGVVLDEAGRPAHKVHLWVLPLDGSRLVQELRSAREAASDEDGRFAFRDLAPGLYQLLAGGKELRESDGSAARVQTAVHVGPNEIVDGVVLRLPRPAGVSGIVRDGSGRPCAGLGVYALAQTGDLLQPFPVCRTKEDGRFECDGLAPGRYSFFARAEEQLLTGRGPLATPSSEWIEVQPQGPLDPRPEVELVAGPATVLHVDLRDAEGKPACADLRLRGPGMRDVGGAIDSGDYDEVLMRSALGYRSRFGPLPPGNYTLEARGANLRSGGEQFTLAGEPERRLTLRVE